ncbi:MAG: S-layer homology domain-containing protein [Oscillospiraceae bacterium]|nr:S-layer homology domain-containing protein [Oscillospiraceae bacterium]
MKVKRKQSVLALALAFVLALSMIPLQTAAATDEAPSAYGTNEQIMPFSGDVVSVPGDYATLFLAISGTPVDGARTIVLTDNIIMAGHVSITQGRQITLIPDGNDRTLYRTAANTQRHFSVDSGTLVIDACSNGNTITLTRAASNTGNGGGIGITTGTFILNAGTISNNQTANGAGVNVTQGSTFIMNGGTISGNTATGNGGGVNVAGIATALFNTFTMNGGMISGNTANNGGGVSQGNNSTFTMHNGFIENNTASGANIYLGGGGVFMEGANAQFNMHNGMIRGNNALRGGGVRMIGGTFIMHNGEISGNLAQHVPSTASNGGGFGGGVMVTNTAANFIMHNGAIIDNTAEGTSGQQGGGGGVFVNIGASFTMYNGAISGNEATSGRGGGVFMEAANTQFTMNNGAISGNTAHLDGGGVSVANGIVTMSDGIISNNTATQHGGGVWLATGAATVNARLNMSGGTISGNTTVTGDGGGIFATATNMQTSPPVDVYPQIIAVGTISNNTAGGGRFALPTNATDITRGIGSLMDNYNINYRGSTQLIPVIFNLAGGNVSGNTENITHHSYPNTTVGAANVPVPSRLNYSFQDWRYTGQATGAQNLTNADVAEHTVTAPITFTAQWVLETRTVTFNSRGGSAVPGQSVSHGGFAASPATPPTLAGHTFGGWFTSESIAAGTGGKVFDFVTTPITANITLYARWTPNNHQGGSGGGITPPPSDDPWREAFLIGVSGGDGSRWINPRANITRAEVATIFFRLIDDDVRADYWMQTNPFDDVALNQWFNNAVSTTAHMGLFVGVGNDQFAPQNNITRGELATVLVRFMYRDQTGTFSAPLNDSDQFNDIAGHWARSYINEATRQGWIEGDTGIGGQFRPSAPLTRAETAAMINRMFERLIETYDCRLYDMVSWPDNVNRNSWYFLYMYMATNSFHYRWRDNGYMELREIIEPREWWRLERPNSQPEDIFIRS